MAQNITLLGANYPDVPAVQLPITGGGTATFSDTRSVTYNLTGGASASVNPSEVVAGQGFSVKLTAPTGYVLSGVTVTMGGVDITSQVFTPDESGGGGGGGESWQETASESVIIISGSPNYFMISNYTTPFLSDETYRVTWGQGGTQYTCNTEAIGSPAYDGYCVGNKAIVGVGSDTGEPFFLYRSSTTQLVGGTTNAAGTIYIKIEKKVSGGGGSAVLISKSVTANGTYTASDDSADGYSDVTVNVANSYAAGDEGKVVSNGALVAQGSDTVTQNGTVDTTLISSLLVNVAGTSPVKTATGTFTGNGTRTVDISCDFEPDLIYWSSDPGTTASSGVVAGIIAREMMAAARYRNNSTTNSHYAVIDITAMNTGGSSYSFRATYANSTVTLYCFSSNARTLFTNSRTYTYKFVKWTT